MLSIYFSNKLVIWERVFFQFLLFDFHLFHEGAGAAAFIWICSKHGNFWKTTCNIILKETPTCFTTPSKFEVLEAENKSIETKTTNIVAILESHAMKYHEIKLEPWPFCPWRNLDT